MRQKSFDNYLLTIMSIVALLSLYMLYGTKLVSFNSGEELKVASIIEQLKTVKRKRDFYQGWVDVKQGDNLSQNDEIYTHGQSSAKIRFTNGSEISLFENSLLRIKTAAKGSTLSLDKGNLIATLNKDSPNLDIELAGKKYSFNSENANIQIEQGKTENKFLLLDGKAKLADKEILPNQVVIQNIKTGKMEIKAIPFILKSPENNRTQYFVKEASMNFSWSYTNGEVPAKLMIARDSDFTDVVSNDANRTENFSEAGTYYWKLVSETSIASPIRSFTLIEETAPSLSTDKEIVYVGPKSKEKIFLNWSKNNGKKFLMRIEDSSGGKSETLVSKNHFEFSPPAISSYKISVKVNDENRPLALWSEPVFIDVKEAASITINSLTPDLIEKVNYKNEATNFMLSWNGPPGSINYKIRLTKNGKTIENETDHTSLPLNLKEPGDYTWEVTGETLSGVTSNKLTGKIIIKTPLRVATLPAEGAVVELDKPDQMVNFKWDKVDEATQYQFELSDEPTFKKIMVDREIDSNNISTTLAETGKYFWRVRIKKGSKVEYSSPVSVEIKPSPPLSRPEVSPDIKIKLKYMDEKSSSFNLFDFFIGRAEAADQIAIAEWDLPANPRAKSYTVEVYKDPELKELVIKIETELPHAVWRNAAAGKFYWRVLYNDFWGRKTEFSKVSVLSTEAEVPEEIELQNPKHRTDILKRDGDSFIFEWNPIKNAKNYQLFIASDLEFEKIILKKQISQTEVKISCKDLNAGDYFWKVQSGESSSKRRQFAVQCEKPLPPPEPKPEPKIEIAEVKPAPVVVKIEEEKTNPRFLRAGLFPHTLSYSNKASSYSSKVSGTVIDSWSVMYQSPLDLKYFQLVDTSLWVARGKVFKEITFTDIDFKVRAHRVQSSFSWGPVAAFMKKTLYVESNLKIADEGISSPLLGLFLQKEFRPFTFEAEVKGGSMINFQAGLQYRLKNNISVGVLFDSTSLTKDENKHSFTKIGLNVNYTLDFLDKK